MSVLENIIILNALSMLFKSEKISPREISMEGIDQEEFLKLVKEYDERADLDDKTLRQAKIDLYSRIVKEINGDLKANAI